jgi:protein phosphatase
MSDERAVEVGQLGQPPQPYAYQANVGYFEPHQLADLTRYGRLYLIADPISGTASGQTAGQYAIKKIIHTFYTSDVPDLKERLLAAIRQANADILEENNRRPERRPMATTLAVAWIQENKLLVASVGDNRVYVVWDQDIELLTQAVSPSEQTDGDKSEAAAIKLLPAKIEPPPEEKPMNEALPLSPRQRLPNGLGLDREVKINLFSRRLFPGDIVVLCSGGLAGYLDEKEMARIVNRHPPQEAIKRLLAIANEQGNRDPLAISVIRLLSSPVGLQPPAPMPLPLSPSWNDLKTSAKSPLLSQPLAQPNQSGAKAATSPMKPVTKSMGSWETKTVSNQRVAQFLETMRLLSSQWGWQSYALMGLVLLLICVVPILVWQYLASTDLIPAVPFLADAEATGADRAEPFSQEDVTGAGNEFEPPGQGSEIGATITPSVASSSQLTVTLVAQSNSPVAVPESAFVSPVSTPGNPAQGNAQTATDSIVILATPSPTPLAIPTIVLPANCENGARFFRDVTVPDGTSFAPGENFEKVWLLSNAKSCPWGPGYTVRFMGGDLMNAAQQLPLLEVVSPNTNGEIKVPMVAPNKPGRYRGEWQLHDLAGTPFGAVMYVEIEVVGAADVNTIDQVGANTLYDFVRDAGEAVWSSGDVTYVPQTTTISEQLPLPSPQGLVASGIAQLRGNKESEKNVLLTYPHQEVGYIQGVYRVETPLQPTDTLVANLGFTKLSILSDDGVTFEVSFKPNDGSAEWVILSKTVQYRESPLAEVVPLTNIQPGQTGAFTLRVLGGDSLSQDWAIWLDLRLVRP